MTFIASTILIIVTSPLFLIAPPIWAICDTSTRPTPIVSEIVRFSAETDAAERAIITEIIMETAYDFRPLIAALGHPIDVTSMTSGRADTDYFVSVDLYYRWPQGVVINVQNGAILPKLFMHEVGHIHDVYLKPDASRGMSWGQWQSLELPYLDRPQEQYANRFMVYYKPCKMPLTSPPRPVSPIAVGDGECPVGTVHQPPLCVPSPLT